jgi:hypothetical protein
MVLTPEDGDAGASGHLSVALINNCTAQVFRDLDVF